MKLKERAYSVEDAIYIWEKEIKGLGLYYGLETKGGCVKTNVCTLYRSDNNKAVANGFGKGLGIQSKASACYEALEHYYTMFSNNSLEVILEKYENTLQIDPYLANDGILTLQEQVSKIQNRNMGVVVFTEYKTKQKVKVPAYLVDPLYDSSPINGDEVDYKSLFSRSSNNGTAIGLSFEEAMIHSISEIIERDAYSLFLISSFAKKQADKIKIIDKKTLPKDAFSLISDVEKEFGEDLIVLFLESEFGVATFCVVTTNQPFLSQARGFGSSLFPCYALERALLEVTQDIHLHEFCKMDEKFHSAKNKLSKWPAFIRCIDFDVMKIVNENYFQLLDFVEIQQQYGQGNISGLDEHLSILIENIYSKGQKIYYTKMAELSSGITCVKVLISGMEDFFVVTSGQIPLPGLRGKRILMA